MYNIALMGAIGVGKTSIVRKFVKECYCEECNLRGDQRKTQPIMRENEEYLLGVIEAHGVDNIQPIEEYCIRNSDGFLLIYSLIDYSTFTDIKTIREKLVNIKGTEKVPIVLVGNKSDLADDSRAVETSMAAGLAAKWPNCRFIEASARNHDEIESVFIRCVDAIEELRFEWHKEHNKKILRSIICSIL